MIPRVQSRIGKNGTCFRTCIASILNLREEQVPDFKEANLDPGVDKFLRKYGLSYKEIPAEDDNAPLGLHLALGTSPRGGMHAVVCKDGKLLHDPHPQDGTGRGLVKVERYGLLLPLKASATDATLLKGKRLHTAAEALRVKHDEVMYSPSRFGGTMENMYRATNRPVMDLVNEAASLLTKAKLDDDPVYWQGKLATAKKALEQATVNARQGGYERAVQQQEYALTLAHMVIDKMRNTGRARDALDKRARLHRALDRVMDRSMGKVKDSQNAHVGMLGVNAEKAQALKRQLERKGFEYRFPAEPPKEDIVRHAFRKGPVGEENEWRILNERKNGFHNITEMR